MRYSEYRLVQIICVLLSLLLTSGFTIPNSVDNVKVETKHVVENNTLLLVCNSTELRDVVDFFWIKNDTLAKGSELYATGWKLEFFAIERTASGIYSCHALKNSTGENITLTATNVDVQYPTECRSMSLEPRVITENQTFDVTCSMHGNPEPHWGVYNNDTGVAVVESTISGDASIDAIPVRCGYSGFWVCTGYNKLNKGVNATRGYHLTVLCPPRPDPYSQPILHYGASVHNNITMALKVSADPVPSYTWSRPEGEPMGDVAIESGSNGTTLTIRDVNVTDFGNYTLKLNNSMGSYTEHFTLHAYGYPQRPYNLQVSNISYNSVDLSWTSGYDMGTKQYFMIAKIVGNVFMTISGEIRGSYTDGGLGHRWSYRQTNLDGDTEYTLAVMAENAENFTFSEHIEFKTASTPPHHPHYKEQTSSVAVIAGGIVGGIVLLLLVIGAASVVYRRRPGEMPLKGMTHVHAASTHAGGSVGGFVLLLVVVGPAFVVYRKRRHTLPRNKHLRKGKGPLISHESSHGTFAVNGEKQRPLS